MTPVRMWMLVSSVMISVIGCSAPKLPIIDPMVAVPALALQAPADKARLVIIRPNVAYGSGTLTPIVHATKQEVLGVLVSDQAATFDLEPGTHQLCATSIFHGGPMLGGVAGALIPISTIRSAGIMVEAQLAAGKTYYLVMEFSGGRPQLLAAKAGTSGIEDEARRVRASYRQGAGKATGSLAPLVEACSAARAAASGKDRDRSTLAAADGR